MADKIPNPMVLAGKKKVDAMRRRGRAYGLGERRPDTLPGVYGPPNRSETVEENRTATARWHKLGKLSRGVAWTGNKY